MRRRLTNWLDAELSTALFLLVMLVVAVMHPRAAVRDLLSMWPRHRRNQVDPAPPDRQG